MDIVTKEKINILIQLAEADKEFAIEEREMIYRIARDRHFPDTAVADLIKSPYPIYSLGALSKDQKLDYLLSSVELVLVDRHVRTSEVVLFKSIAIKLGYHKNVVDFLIQNFEKSAPEDLKKKVFNDFRLT